MKIRHDFISNSSSSSFVLWGVCLHKNELIKSLESSLTRDIYESVQNKWMPDYDNFIIYLNQGKSEYIIDFLCNYFSSVIYDYGNDEFYIGENPNKMSDNETLLQFKTKIIESLKKLSKDFIDEKVEFFSGIENDGYVELNC